MALVMSSPILCSSKSLDGPSGELPESPFTFSQALQKVKAVFPNGSPVPTKYKKVAPCSRKRPKDRRARGQGSDSHPAARRPNVRASAPMTDALPKPAGHSRALRAFCRLRSARLRPLFSAKQLRSLAGRCAPRFASACPHAFHFQAPRLPPRKKGASIRAPDSPPRRTMTAHHDGPTSRLIGCRAPPRKRPSGVLPRIPAFCLSSPSLL